MKTICISPSASTVLASGTPGASASGFGFLPSVLEKPSATEHPAVSGLHWYAQAARHPAEIWEDAMLLILGASGLAGTALALL